MKAINWTSNTVPISGTHFNAFVLDGLHLPPAKLYTIYKLFHSSYLIRRLKIITIHFLQWVNYDIISKLNKTSFPT